MGKELGPFDAAAIAKKVYSVNANDSIALRLFLGNKMFSRYRPEKKQLNAEVGGRLFRAAKDSFGLCALGGGAQEGDLFLIFRGTTTENNKADFVTDARLGITRSKTGSPVHIGFNHAFNSMLPELQEFIAQNQITGRVHCIGHSLGGAVATLAAEWVACNTSRPVTLYTFGQPRVGMLLFAMFCTSRIGKHNIHRVFHTTDPVPMVPVFPYTHSPITGYGCRVITNNPIHTGEAHYMETYETNMADYANWAALGTAPPLNSHEQAIKGWLRSNADSNPACPKTFAWLESALIWLMSKVLARAVSGIQLALMGIHSFVDMAAYVLAKGLEVGEAVSEYTRLFLIKAMKILGMKFKEGITKMTRTFIYFILESLIKRANQMAQKAVRGLAGQ